MIETNTFLLYCFYALMIVSGAFCVDVVLREILDKETERPPNRFWFAGILFCLAAIAAKMWGGFGA